MPSPKAVLRDITDLKLDPKKAHNEIRASGRLRPRQEKHVHVTHVSLENSSFVEAEVLEKILEVTSEAPEEHTSAKEETLEVVVTEQEQVQELLSKESTNDFSTQTLEPEPVVTTQIPEELEVIVPAPVFVQKKKSEKASKKKDL